MQDWMEGWVNMEDRSKVIVKEKSHKGKMRLKMITRISIGVGNSPMIPRFRKRIHAVR